MFDPCPSPPHNFKLKNSQSQSDFPFIWIIMYDKMPKLPPRECLPFFTSFTIMWQSCGRWYKWSHFHGLHLPVLSCCTSFSTTYGSSSKLRLHEDCPCPLSLSSIKPVCMPRATAIYWKVVISDQVPCPPKPISSWFCHKLQWFWKVSVPSFCNYYIQLLGTCTMGSASLSRWTTTRTQNVHQRVQPIQVGCLKTTFYSLQ